jgi:proteasome accessory factor A
MRTPAICGLETEYGLWVAKPEQMRQEDAALALLLRCPLKPLYPWDSAGESPGQDARSGRRGTRHPTAGPAAVQEPAVAEDGSHPGFLLGNGARLYVDHGHPEYSTPECPDALAVVASDRAGEQMLERCRRHLNQFLPVNQSVRLFKNNSDGHGHSYGCHENYLLSSETYESLFDGRRERLFGHLIPFLVSRIVVCGAGKVGSENGRSEAPYQISQRADFFETLLGVQTMSRRPIVNTRDEPHTDGRRFRRLHVISGDANMAQVSTYLKVGTFQLFLALLEDGAPLPDLTLEDPLSSMIEISHDPTCRRRVRLADGRQLTAVEMQRELADAAQRHLARSPSADAAFGEVLRRWSAALEKLAVDPMELAGTLDWVIKWKCIDERRERKGLSWAAMELRELDLRYHDVDPDGSLFHLLESSSRVERLVEPETILRAEEIPPQQTRAAYRAALLREYGDDVQAASWSTVVAQQQRIVIDDVVGGQEPSLTQARAALQPD